MLLGVVTPYTTESQNYSGNFLNGGGWVLAGQTSTLPARSLRIW
jgi:hypothetical protein